MSDWFKDALENFQKYFLKFTKSSRIKFEITSLHKKKDERVKYLGGRAVELIKEGKLDASLLEPDYSNIMSICEEIELKKKELEDLNKPEVKPVIPLPLHEDEKNVEDEKVESAFAEPIVVPPTSDKDIEGEPLRIGVSDKDAPVAKFSDTPPAKTEEAKIEGEIPDIGAETCRMDGKLEDEPGEVKEDCKLDGKLDK